MRPKIMLAIALVAAVCGARYFLMGPGYKIVNYPPAGSGPIVAFGDSLTFGTGAARGEAYPDVLSKLIGRPIVNKGVPGDKIGDASARLERDVLKLKPSIVIVLLGGNDLLSQMPLDESFKELERVVQRIQRGGAMVVLVGLRVFTPIGGLGARYSSIARHDGCVLVDDVLDDIITDRTLMSDQIHPNARGYKIVAERIAKVMKPYLVRP